MGHLGNSDAVGHFRGLRNLSSALLTSSPTAWPAAFWISWPERFGDGTLVHLRALERAGDGYLQRLAFEAGEQRLFGDPGVLNWNLQREGDGFVEADGALRTHHDVADLELHVLVIHAAIDDAEVHLLIADRKQRALVGGWPRIAAFDECFDLLREADPWLRHRAGRDADRVDGQLAGRVGLLRIGERHAEAVELHRELAFALRGAGEHRGDELEHRLADLRRDAHVRDHGAGGHR